MAKHPLDLLFIDIDHTLSDAWWRDAFIEPYGGHENVPEMIWMMYHNEARNDNRIQEAVEFVNMLISSGWSPVILTSRNEAHREATRLWLANNGLLCANTMAMLMRPDGDRTPSAPLKVALAEAYVKEQATDFDFHFSNYYLRHRMVIDDRADVCAAFSAIGYSTLQFTSGRKALHESKGKSSGEAQAQAPIFKEVG